MPSTIATTISNTLAATSNAAASTSSSSSSSLSSSSSGAQIVARLLDAYMTTTISPVFTSSFETPQQQDETVASLPDTVNAQILEVPDSKPLDFLNDLFTHLASSSSGAALLNALLASFSVIIVSELGDKTFIITAIMAMKNSRFLVGLASSLALLVMTILSVGMGVAVTVIPKQYTHYASIVLFLCFGLKMLHEAYFISNEEEPQSEFEEVQKSLEDNEVMLSKANVQENQPDGGKDASIKSDCSTTQPSSTLVKEKNALSRTLYMAPIVIKVFTMIFVAEWGDRSQISTVILAARENVVGVFIGSLTGHILCTILAVIGGRFVADIISVRTMTLLGGLIFLFFATFAIFSGPE